MSIFKRLRPFLVILSVSTLAVAINATVGSTPVLAQERVTVQDYDVFVDLPTAFAFIKLPGGWKFIGKLDASQLRHLPTGTLTALMTPEDGPTRLAGQEHRTLLAKAGSTSLSK